MTPHRHNRKLDSRCPGCGLPGPLCICSLAPRPEIRTEFLIVCHVKETQRASNTARLAQLVMPATRILLRGVKDRVIPAGEFEREGTERFVLFPSPEAEEIGPAFAGPGRKPLLIVVPDGSWRQAACAVRREPGLKDLPRLKLPPGPASRYALRVQPAPGRVSTFEAIARVVGILEGAEKQKLLEDFLDEMVRRNLSLGGERPGSGLPF